MEIQIENCKLLLGKTEEHFIEFNLPEFHLESGQHVGLTGPSGCGKSTLLNLVSGLLTPNSGKILIQNNDFQALSPFQRDVFRGKTFGFIFQSFNLLEGFTALENILVGMRFGRAIPPPQRKTRGLELLERVGLQKKKNVLPSKLSVGERQRVAIARALANKPPILLADEPTGSLDPLLAEEIFSLIKNICTEEKRTLLLVTHDLTLANRLEKNFDCRNLVRHQPRGKAKS